MMDMPRRILVAQALPAGESAAAPIRSVILLLSVAIFSVAMLPVEAVADETSLPATNRAEGTKAAQGAEGTVEQARDVVYASYDGVELTADLYLPRAAVRAPAAVLVHGGAWAWGSRDQMAGLAESLAEQGVAAMNISYRLAPEHKFPAQLIDVAAALGWLRLHADTYRIDSSRVAGIGYSAGGHLVMLLANLHGSKAGDARALQHEIAAGVRQGVAARQDEAAALAWSQIAHLQAIAAGGAPGDLRTFPPNERSLAYWLGSTRTEQPDLYRLASPAYHVTGGSPFTASMIASSRWAARWPWNKRSARPVWRPISILPRAAGTLPPPSIGRQRQRCWSF